MPAPEGYSGLQFLAGTSKEFCTVSRGCKLFSKQEIESLLAGRIDGFTDLALFGIMTCRLEPDYKELLRREDTKARKSSVYEKDPLMKASLSTLRGEWCGLTEDKPNHSRAQMRIIFIQDSKMMKGQATLTWAHIGQSDYVDRITLIPIGFKTVGLVKEFTFQEVSRYRSGTIWKLYESSGEFYFYQEDWGKCPMSHSCDGFWKDDKL